MRPSVTAIAKPAPDGERIFQAVIELNGTECDINEIIVKDRTIISREKNGDTITLTLSDKDEKTLKGLGIDVTSDPEYVTNNLYYS